MLQAGELGRYDRQIILPEIGIEGQEKLKNAKVLVIGAGGLGSPVLQYLAAAGIGTLGIMDFDRIDESNLHRQILYRTTDIGKPKARTAADALKKSNPWVEFQVFDERLQPSNAMEIISSFDIVVDGSDNFATRYLVNDACIIANKPLVFGSIFKFEGQVTVFNYQGSGSYRCLFPEEPSAGEVPGCGTIGVLGVLPGIIGTLQTNEVLKIVLQIGNVLAGKLLTVDALTMEFNTYSYQKSQENFNIANLEQQIICCAPFETKSEIVQVTVSELSNMISSHADVQIIDVREIDEYRKKNIGGLHIPLGELRNNIEKVNRNIPVIFYCQSGGRSSKAIEFLAKEYGFNNLKNLSGGLNAWYAHHN
jgi:molybdopterin/thiamine biosynthesis adenylyltransferase/rhodanese-related sulfurtransferase